ncbi:TOTE conflict system archaeo-eukaryotic primase domain-containing protein [Jeotgalibacillus proteolyticus]|uniref:TOTE conflict system archaeo-eukaryotic primase domain-containing protein n=1 Tax=Jeotgalibacillus proteolyticus TaxID=2082395 RepID=UPI003CF741B2
MSIERNLKEMASENERLKKQVDQYRLILEKHNLLPRENNETPPPSNEINKNEVIRSRLQIYKSLFRGREDVFAQRWTSGEQAGYSPVKDQNGSFAHLTEEVLYRHLSGEQTVGLYPLRKDHSCFFLAFDFDKKNWKDDVSAFGQACARLHIQCSFEISQSGEGCHVWLFFSEKVQASLSRQLGNLLLTEAAFIRGTKKLKSFDRMFPVQDYLTENGLGNLIALPLQGEKRKLGRTVFVDQEFQIIKDQWEHLKRVQRYSCDEIQKFVDKAVEGKAKTEVLEKNQAVLREGILVPKSMLNAATAEKLTKMCTVNNPEYFKAKAQRLSTDRIPSQIKAYSESTNAFVFPRGRVEEVLAELGEGIELKDLRHDGKKLEVDFLASLFPQQQEALDRLKAKNCGVLSATTGFGKTVVASALIAERKVNTLILVHRNQLIQQWKAAISSFLSIEPDQIGQIGGGKNRPTGQIDIATIQSIRNKEIPYQYGQVIVDECHHISAYSFEEILKKLRSAYVHGLTATPVRKDGLHPLMFMQCGPIVYKADAKNQAEIRQFHHLIHPRITNFKSKAVTKDRQDVYNQLIHDEKRNEMIFNDILNALDHKRNPLVLTERVEHLHLLVEKLKHFTKNMIILTGALSKKELQAQFQKLASVPDHEERIILATGKYAGEGFDNPRLDTIFLTMPVSWKGTLAQYVGRLHRAYEGKESVEVYDYVDQHEAALMEKYEKRLKGYKSLGYSTAEEAKKEKKQMKLF